MNEGRLVASSHSEEVIRGLIEELNEARSHPLKQLSILSAYITLTLCSKIVRPVASKTAQRFARSAAKRHPNRAARGSRVDECDERIQNLEKELSHSRRDPLKQLRRLIVYSILIKLSKASPPLPTQVAKRYERSAAKRNPNRASLNYGSYNIPTRPKPLRTIDRLEAEQEEAFSYDGLSDQDKASFPFGFSPERATVPLIIVAEEDLEMASLRARQALAITSGDVHVLIPKSAPGSLGLDDVRLREWRFDNGAIDDTYLKILADCDAEHVGFWSVWIDPAIIAWPLLFGTIARNKNAIYVGALIVDSDGRLCNERRDDASANEDTYFRDPDRFRLHRGATQTMIGVANRRAMLSSIDDRRKFGGDFAQPDLSEALVFDGAAGAGEVYTQGCAIAVSKKTKDSAPSMAEPSAARPTPVPREAIVFVDSGPPLPDQDAGSVTADNFVDIALERGADVYFYSTGRRSLDDPYNLAIASRGVILLHAQATQGFEHACSFIAQRNYDHLTLILTRVSAGGIFLEAVRRRFPKAKIVFNTVDLHGLREIRQARMSNSASSLFSAHETFARECDLIRRSDATILLSEEEMAELKPSLGYANLRLIPLISEFGPRAANPQDRHDLAFIGGFAHQPNVDAVEYIFEELWAPIRDRCPNVRLKIVGPKFPERLKRVAPDGVDVLGFVPDLAGLLGSLRMTIAPLRYGAGIKGKISTSLAHGVPCVATPVAVEGMGLRHKESVLIAKTPEAFANEIAHLNDDDALWSQLSRDGYDFCETRYSRRAVSKDLNTLLDELSK